MKITMLIETDEIREAIAFWLAEKAHVAIEPADIELTGWVARPGEATVSGKLVSVDAQVVEHWASHQGPYRP